MKTYRHRSLNLSCSLKWLLFNLHLHIRGIPRKTNACKDSYRYPDREADYVSLRKSFSFRRSHFSNARYRENILTNFNFNTLSFLRVVVGERRLHIFVIVRRWSLASLDGFSVRRWLNCVWMSSCSRSFLCPRSTRGKRIYRLYREFSFSVSESNARIWLNSRDVVCGRFELYLSWRDIGKCWYRYACSF